MYDNELKVSEYRLPRWFTGVGNILVQTLSYRTGNCFHY